MKNCKLTELHTKLILSCYLGEFNIKAIRLQITLFANFFSGKMINLCLPNDMQFISPGSFDFFFHLEEYITVSVV